MLHGHLATMPVEGTPLDTPLDALARFVPLGRARGAPRSLLDRLADRLAGLGPRLAGEVVPLHGDAHPGNLLAPPDGWRWTDLGDTCAGPHARDLACLRSTSRLDGRAASDALRGPADHELAPWPELRRLHAAAWSLVAAAGHPRLRPAADERLAAAVGAGQASGSAGSR